MGLIVSGAGFQGPIESQTGLDIHFSYTRSYLVKAFSFIFLVFRKLQVKFLRQSDEVNLDELDPFLVRSVIWQ